MVDHYTRCQALNSAATASHAVPNWSFNADAHTPHASDTPYGRRLTLALGSLNTTN